MIQKNIRISKTQLSRRNNARIISVQWNLRRFRDVFIALWNTLKKKKI